jgi:hypothetical protein
MPDFSERRPNHQRKKRYRQYQTTDSLLISHSLKSSEPAIPLAGSIQNLSFRVSGS